MNIAIIGYGRMGKEIEQIALSRQHNIVLKTDDTPTGEQLQNVDVAIEFSQPEVAFNNLKTLIHNDIRTICGTTGWLSNYEEIVALTKEKNGGFLYASNYSLGVNLFFELNQKLSKLMTRYPEYKVDLEEIHHTKKLDAPSGTAVTLAEGIIQSSAYSDWYLKGESIKKNSIPITAIRKENVPGTHTVKYFSEIDEISITHIAHNRKGFAQGAVIAAEWIHGKTGVFTMKDVLGL